MRSQFNLKGFKLGNFAGSYSKELRWRDKICFEN